MFGGTMTTMTKAKITTTMVTVALGAALALAGCGDANGEPLGAGGQNGNPIGAGGASGAGAQAAQGSDGVTLPKQPTEEAAPAGTLDAQLVGAWPVTSVQVYWDGSGVIDSTASEPLRTQLAAAPLLLGADGTFSLGTVTGTWTVIPFLATDKALWGTGGRGPEGYLREIVLVVNGRVYMRGPIDDPFPPATAPWGLRVAFRVASPQAGNVIVMFQRPAMNTGGGGKK